MAQSDVVQTVICSFVLFSVAQPLLGAVGQSTNYFLDLMENLAQMSDGTLAETAHLCENGSHATLERAIVYMGNRVVMLHKLDRA